MPIINMSRGALGTLMLCILATAIGCGSSTSTPDARSVKVTCDPVVQDCATGTKCNPTGPALGPWTGTACADDNGATGSPAGTPCFTGDDGTDTCDGASTCLQFGTGEGACLSFCANDQGCNAADRCVLYDEAIGLRLCTQRCNLDAPDCPRWHECIASRAGGACIPFAWRDGVPR